MKDYTLNVRLFLYVAIAVFTAMATETSTSQLPIFWAVFIKATLQGLIAWRAFIDETPAMVRIKKEKEDKEVSSMSAE